MAETFQVCAAQLRRLGFGRYCQLVGTLSRSPRPHFHASASTYTRLSSPSPLPEHVASLPSRTAATPRLAQLKNAELFSSFLTDSFARQHTYLRISIMERCNLRCLYCMPAAGVPLSPQSHLLTAPEISYLSSVFVSQGVTKIRLTGGEPTVHPQILSMLHEIGRLRSDRLKELCLTTNGLTLSRKLDSMVDAGVTGINLSLDTLDPAQFEMMTRRKGSSAVMKSIAHILALKRSGGASNLNSRSTLWLCEVRTNHSSSLLSR
jgi:cyclic pyranopterin phosphate synthase